MPFFRYIIPLTTILLICCSKQHSVILYSSAFSVLGYLSTNWMIPKVGNTFIRIGLFGKDMSKPGRPVIPESIGAVSAGVYLLVMLLCTPFMFYKYMATSTNSVKVENPASFFPHDKLAEYLSSILCLESTVLLGIADDLFDLRWRHKFFLPAIGAIPLLIIYYVDFGCTHVLLPGFLQNWVQIPLIDLGFLYYAYMGAMTIFCPNAINILAGVNGLEVGQSIVLSLLSLINDGLYLTLGHPNTWENHRFSAMLILPFLWVSVALYNWNRWPARVFVGDTYCYFAGMVFAVVGILGHFSKTMLLLFLPQILNFLYSVPQLFHIVPCPRHRLPHFNEKNGLLYPSRANLQDTPPKRFFIPVLKFLSFFKLINLEYNDKGQLMNCTNMTLINLTLVWFGPRREDKLCSLILKLQFIVGISSLIARHALGKLLFGHDNLWTID